MNIKKIKSKLESISQSYEEIKTKHIELEVVYFSKNKVEAMQSKLDNLAMREVVCRLEHWISVEIVKSKTKIQNDSLHCISNIERYPRFKQRLEQLLTIEERNLIGYLKIQMMGFLILL